MSTQLISEAAIRRLSTGAGREYFFNLSEISADDYDPLFGTLEIFALTDVDAIGFSCDKLASGHPPPAVVAASIAQQKPDYMSKVTDLLCSIVPKSKCLASVQFVNLPMSREHLERLSDAFGRSRSLRAIRFSKVELKNDGLRVVLLGLNPNVLESVEILNCRITEAATDDILRFIGRRVKIERGLKTFDVTTSDISAYGRKRIAVALAGRPASPFSEDDSPEEDSDSDEINFTVSDRRETIAHLRAQNALLVEQIQVLRDLADESRDDDAMFIVGPGAREFQRYMNDIERRVAALLPEHRM
jgi:hypothetical protein